MAIEYVNRKGRNHYLHVGTTKTGKSKYFCSMKSEGSLMETIPEGYEIYEHPSAQVFLRKVPPQIILPEELAIVREGVKKIAEITPCIMDVKDKHIVLYLCDQNLESLMEITSVTPGQDPAKVREVLVRSLSYSPMMQFVLDDAQTREFVVERWCFLGSVDDWISLDQSTNLKDLVAKYSHHLGQESFYDLMPHGE